jgi:MFS family permease
VLQATSAGAIAVLYALYLSALGYGTEFIGLTVVIATVGGALGILPASPLVHRLGWRAMLIWSNVIGGLSIAIQVLMPTPPVIIITTLGVGASVAMVLVVNLPFLTANSTPDERTALFGLNTALAFLAGVLGSLLGGFLPAWFASPAVAHSAPITALAPLLVADAKARSYELAMLAVGALALPSIFPIFYLRDAPHEDLPGVPGALPWRKRLALLAAEGRHVATGVIGRFSLAQALLGFGAGLFLPYVNLYFVRRLGTSTEFFGVLSAALAVAIAAASLLSAPLADRFGKLPTSILAQASSVPFLLALGAFPVVWLASAALLVRTFLMNLTGAPLQTYLMEAVPERARVIASSVYNVTYQLAIAAGSGLGGLVIARAGYRPVFLAAAPFYTASAFLLLIWFGRHRSEKLG